MFFKRSAILYRNRPFCVFEPPLGDLGATYDDHLRLIGERVVDFLLVLILLFSPGLTAEEVRANIGSKSAIMLQRGPVDPKFQNYADPNSTKWSSKTQNGRFQSKNRTLLEESLLQG